MRPEERAMIDTNFNMYTDANGGDPDATSPTLRTYHRLLWSKPLPSGDPFDLFDDKPGHYLCHSSALGDFSLGSDAITHSYKNQIKKRWLTEQVPNQVQERFDIGTTIGAYIIFPTKRIDRKQTINQARGMSRLIDDRFDLTLECIRRFYISEPSPLDVTIKRYTSFFQLFGTFEGYVDFFLLNDLVGEHGDVKFYLPFDDFQSPPEFKDVEDYLLYKNRVGLFVEARNKRIDEYTIKAAT